MQDLEKHEQFEMEVLDRLNTARLLPKLVFVGGTMLRLCHSLDRYSVDLDFWVTKKNDFPKMFIDLKKLLARHYKLTDACNKHFTLLFEFKKEGCLRALKIEIRKEIKNIGIENLIAYSPFSDVQVMLKAIKLDEMMIAKINAFFDRGEIRDVYDIEFMRKRGLDLNIGKRSLKKLLNKINLFTSVDYNVKLGSLIGPERRKFYRENKFKILTNHIKSKL